MAGSGTGGRRGARSGARVSPPPTPTPSASAILRKRRRGFSMDEREEVAGAIFRPAPGREQDRPDFDDVDLTEPDDLELWMAGQLRDWQLVIGAETLGQLRTICENMLDVTKREREAVRNDLRREGYLEGQINVLETIIDQVGRAVEARRARIGELPT